MTDLRITPDPSEEEVAAIVAAIEVTRPRAGAAAPVASSPRWRWSGRWWTKPIPQRRNRPY
jgi:hypothetical protein